MRNQIDICYLIQNTIVCKSLSNYIEIKIENISSAQSEILIAQLSEIGFEGFEEGENFLSAYIEQGVLNEIELKNLLSSNHLTHSKKFIEQKTGMKNGKKILHL